ncbi:MAG: AroM family protein [Gemmatimonadales bacterium]
MPTPRPPVRRAQFVTIGQTPRVDLVPEMAGWIGSNLEIVERGALDGMSMSDVARLRPTDDEQRLVTRLADGTEAVLPKDWTRGRVQQILDEAAREEFDLTVLLCTGHLPGLIWQRGHGLFLEAQRIVDHGVAAITEGLHSVGVMVPLERQIAEFHLRSRPGQTLRLSHASPYEPVRLERAAADLEDTDVIVMHCIGYDSGMRDIVAGCTGKPVLLARRLVAAAISQLI